MVFEPPNPVVEGHLLVAPRTHVTDASVNPDLTARVMRVAARLTRDIPAANIITSLGRSATQSIFHLHVDIVPRTPDDGLTMPWTPDPRKRCESWTVGADHRHHTCEHWPDHPGTHACRHESWA